MLAEVKPKEDFQKMGGMLEPRFRAAWRFAEARGWEFRVFTEDDIRTPRLENVRFLRSFRRLDPDPLLCELAIARLKRIGVSNAEELSKSLAEDWRGQAEFIAVIWSLVSRYVISCDLGLPLTMRSEIWYG